MMIVYGVEPTVAMLWLPVALAITVVLALALAYPSTLFGIWYPELQPFAVSFARAAFFLAPGLIALDEVTGTARDLLPFNPLTGLFESYPRRRCSTATRPPRGSCSRRSAAAALILAVSVPDLRARAGALAKLLG